MIYRAPLSADKKSGGSTSVTTEKLTRDAIETMGLDDDVWIEFKFNWSHGHSSPRLSIVHGGMLTDTYWEPLSDKYKAIWTMRNEDFFVLRWAQPDFIREFIRLNSQPYAAGCFIGSECYIPAKDYITSEEHRHWDYAFERQWLFYKVWGRLLFDPETPDRGLCRGLGGRFPGVDGDELAEGLEAGVELRQPTRLVLPSHLGRHAVQRGVCQEQGGKLISIEQLIKQPTLDRRQVHQHRGFRESEESTIRHGSIRCSWRISWMWTAGRRCVWLAATAKRTHPPTLRIELNDIVSWAWHGQYFAEKLRGGVAWPAIGRRKDKSTSKRQ